MAQTIASLAIRLDVESAQLKKQLDDVTKSIKAMERETARATRENVKAAKDFQAALSKTAVVAAAAGAAIIKALSYADEVQDLADAFDISIASVIGFRNSLALAGGKAENLSTTLSKLANNAQQAREGTDSAREAFDKLGISGEDVENLGLDDLFRRVASSLAAIEDPVQRNAVAFEVLGKAAKGVDWKKYAEEYGEQVQVSEEVAKAIQEGAMAWENLERAGKKALEAILLLAQPVISAINWIANALNKTKSGQESGSLFAAEFGGIEGFGGATGIDLPPPPDVMAKPSPSGKAPASKKGGYSQIAKSQEGFAAQAESVRQQTLEYARLTELAIRRQQIESQTINMTANQREIFEALNKVEEERAQLLQKTNAALSEEEKKGKKANQEKITALKDQIKAINELKDTEKAAIEEIILLRQAEQNSFETGWNRAFRQFAEDAGNYAKMGEQAFSSFATNMERALDNFVKTGKLNFKDFAASVIQDLIRIQLRAQATALLRQATGAIMGAYSSYTQGDISKGISYQGRASGGPVSAGETYTVGEKGPELFVPNRSGTIIPNHRIGDAMGSITNVTNNYIEAIDVKSFEDRLLGSHNAVWAANQYANKSLATGRMRT